MFNVPTALVTFWKRMLIFSYQISHFFNAWVQSQPRWHLVYLIISLAYFRLAWRSLVTNSFTISKNCFGHWFYKGTLLNEIKFNLLFIDVPKFYCWYMIDVNNFVQFELFSLRRFTMETRFVSLKNGTRLQLSIHGLNC